MKISAKGRYALAAMTHLAFHYGAGNLVTISSISDKLGISKIYLEQIFSLLRREDLVWSAKGAQGGYRLKEAPENISAWQILQTVETGLSESAAKTVGDDSPALEAALTECVFTRLDKAVYSALIEVSLADILSEAEKQQPAGSQMYFI